VGGLCFGIEQPHVVGRAVVEDLAWLVVPLPAEQRVERATQLAMEQPQELRPLLLVVGEVEVVVDDLGRAVE